MKSSLLALLIVFASCVQSKKMEVNPNKLILEDSVTLSSGHRNAMFGVDNPTRGKINVTLSNYDSTDKTFIIYVKEK